MWRTSLGEQSGEVISTSHESIFKFTNCGLICKPLIVDMMNIYCMRGQIFVELQKSKLRSKICKLIRTGELRHNDTFPLHNTHNLN